MKKNIAENICPHEKNITQMVLYNHLCNNKTSSSVTEFYTLPFIFIMWPEYSHVMNKTVIFTALSQVSQVQVKMV